MKIDQEYLKSLLKCFVEANTAYIDAKVISAALKTEVDQKLLFHLEILNDKDMVKRDGDNTGIGMLLDASGDIHYSIVPLRLSAEGHEFYEAISKPEIWKKLKANFENAALDTLMTAGKELLKETIKQSISTIG